MKPRTGLLCDRRNKRGLRKTFGMILLAMGCFTLYVIKGNSTSDDVEKTVSNRANSRSNTSQASTQFLLTRSSIRIPCKPVRNFVFLKTMKTGGSTVASILHRHAIKNDLVLVTAQDSRPSILPDKSLSKPALKYLRYNCSDFPGYNYIANHVHYNRQAMDSVIPDAKYFTILRSPYDQRRSQFYYTSKDTEYSNNRNPFETYLNELKADYVRDGQLIRVMRNGTSQFHTLGFLPKYHTNDTAVALKLIELERELDLVMMMEYFDESIVLLAKLLCWDLEEFVYTFCKLHSARPAPITSLVRKRIDTLNPGDVKLYAHFNRTFWEMVDAYDGDFEADLRAFRRIQRNVVHDCEDAKWKDFNCINLKYDAHQLRGRLYNKQLQWICPRNLRHQQIPLSNRTQCKYLLH
ncbi:galactosylceramide sulfotransferase-like [Ptychodera flava]|uniref:galactosylceramide sulfotransferase-like n=1 Tax=Ptychodera flava TaxID=63121 RepID=UPI00396A9459